MANYYVICDDDCRYEGMTREQILAAIEQGLEQGFVSDPDGAVFTKVKELNANNAVQLWVGTEAEFNALDSAPNISRSVVRIGANGVLYLCSDDSLVGDFENHISNENNPHNVTLEQILGGESLGMNYSTEEMKTGGKWIDGKPIYCKVVQVDSIGTSKDVDLNTGAMSSVVSARGIGYTSTGIVRPIPFVNPNAASDSVSLTVRTYDSAPVARINTGSTSALASAVVIVEYTK